MDVATWGRGFFTVNCECRCACTIQKLYYIFGKETLYTASKVKHHLNIFLEKTVKLSKHEFIFVTCLKRDKVVTIYSKFWFDYH